MPKVTVEGKYPLAAFAPPLTDQLFSQYASNINTLPQGELKDALLSLYNCAKAWWDVPESTEKPSYYLFRGKQVPETPLSKELIDKLWDTTPWMRELKTLSTPQADGLFDNLEGDLRNMAFHLLWFATEITLDREPMTQDKIPQG